MNEMKPIHVMILIFYQWLLTVYTCKNCAFWKVLNYTTMPIHEMIAPSFNGDCWLSIREWKFSLSKKWVLKYTTSTFLFISGFPSMNEMKPIREIIPILYQWLLTMYTSVKSFAFWNVRVKLYNFRVPVYKVVSHPFMKWNPSMKWYPSFTNDYWPWIRV